LPKNLYVKGALSLGNTKISKLPEDLVVLKSINLRGVTDLIELPKNIQLKGKILLRHSKITKKYIEENHQNLLNQCDWET
jgi:hypothetical protein